MNFKVKLLGDEKFGEPYHTVEAESAKDAAEMWHGGPLSEEGSDARVEVKYVVDKRSITKVFYERGRLSFGVE
jgi:hypothetical protein